MIEEQQIPWLTLIDLVRFIGEDRKTPKGLKLLKNPKTNDLFASAYEGQTRITLKLTKGEALEYAFAIIREALK